MNHAPRVPEEEASFTDNGARAIDDAANCGRRDLESEPRTGQPGKTAVNDDEQGRFGDLKQNLTNQWKVRESSAVPRDQFRR